MTSSAVSQVSKRLSVLPVRCRALTPRSARRRATRMPAASSPRSRFPIPMISMLRDVDADVLSLTLDLQLQKVCRAQDARIIVPDRLFAFPCWREERRTRRPRREVAEVFLDALLVLRCRRDNLSSTNQTGFIQLVSVIQDAARRLCDRLPDSRSHRSLYARIRRRVNALYARNRAVDRHC